MEKFVILFTVPKKVLVAIQDIIKIGKPVFKWLSLLLVSIGDKKLGVNSIVNSRNAKSTPYVFCN